MIDAGTFPSDVPVDTSHHAKIDYATDFGDFVSNEEEEADVEDFAEPWFKYDIKDNPHAFYPIYVGEVVNGRYLVEHKLGAGGFSTVWMAHDLQSKTDVALKVMSVGKWADTEARAQEIIVQSLQDTTSSSLHLVTCLTTFQLPGNEGCHHRVLVLPLMGPCLNPYMLRNVPMATRMSAARQLLEAVENLHRAGIVHRDLNDRNCMWGVVPLHNLNRNDKYKALGRPLKQAIPFVDLWKQGELVKPIEFPDNLRTEEFYLGDFGLAMRVDDPITQRGFPPPSFSSPDRFHGNHPSFACDMWSYMVIFAELYLGFPPFGASFDGGIISGLVKGLGPLPEEWKGLYEPSSGRDSWYDQCTTPDPKFNLASSIEYFRPDVDHAERELVYSIMKTVFVYCPEERLTATQLLQDPSFKALMERYGC